nr:hypothetical protein [Tanacetum cinerariifolium]
NENYLEHHIPAAPVAPPGQQVPPQAIAAHVAWVKGQKKVVVLMLLTMDLEIQRNLAHLGAYDMLQELKAMNSKQAEQELLQTTPRPSKKDNPAKDAICHQCGKVGHWKRKCPVYLAELMKKKKLSQGASTSDKENYLEHPISVAPVAPPRQQVPPQAFAAHALWVKGQKEELKAMYSKQAEQELLQTVREFHTSKQEEGQLVSSHVLKMKGYIDNLERLGQPVGQNLAVSLILVSLDKDFDSFVQNYNMHGMGKTVNELHAMLKLHEETLSKKDVNPALHAIRAGRVQKNQKNKPHKAAKGGHGKGKGKMGHASNTAPFAPKPKTPPPPKKDNPAKDVICHQCGLRGSKKLKLGALSLYVGDGHRAAVEAIGTYHLELPISKNNLVYFMAVPRDGIFEIDTSCSNTNDSSMYSITNKRAKINLDSSFLWHCRLGHISNKRIKKLQHDGLLNSIDIESLGKCVSCMSGKMARKPYSHQVERAKDLLGLIHTDECGPFKIVSRQGASYFVTFTDDFSRYGYVYLLKHKHEVFETFKVFQKEVENQLGKTIKSLRSDHECEYMSQEFLDHLKEHEIIAHHTPSYTPQNNRVSERRNRTLLDMTPYEIWHGQAPKLSYLKVWGCEAFVKRDTLTKPDKLDPRSFKCIFIGYPEETIGYSFYNSSENKVFVARNAEFFESKLLDLKVSGSVEDLELIQEEDMNPSVD